MNINTEKLKIGFEPKRTTAWGQDLPENTDIGWYTLSVSEDGQSSAGYFGDSTERHYAFRRRLVDGILQEQSYGYGQGDFWNEWGPV